MGGGGSQPVCPYGETEEGPTSIILIKCINKYKICSVGHISVVMVLSIYLWHDRCFKVNRNIFAACSISTMFYV